jgi:uncharacterized protein DUF5666
MNPEPPNWEPPPAPADPPPVRSRGRLRLLGVAVAIAVVGAAAGFVVTRASSITLASATVAKPSPSGSSQHPPSFGRGGFGFPCASGFAGGGFGFTSAGFCGGATGTITKISGSTLTLRTLQGTETVTTTSATTYSREGKKVSFSALNVGEVVTVRSTHGGPASTTSPPPITATAITIVVPTVTGRVQSVSGNTITLVTSDGQLEYVTTSGATVYQGLRNATATSASVKAGIFIVAQGTETDLTHMTADGIQVLGSMTFTPHSFPNHPRGNASPRPSPVAGSSV